MSASFMNGWFSQIDWLWNGAIAGLVDQNPWLCTISDPLRSFVCIYSTTSPAYSGHPVSPNAFAHAVLTWCSTPLSSRACKHISCVTISQHQPAMILYKQYAQQGRGVQTAAQSEAEGDAGAVNMSLWRCFHLVPPGQLPDLAQAPCATHLSILLLKN